MRLLKESKRSQPTLSLVFLDWSVRESFHSLHYLSRQTIQRDDFEIIIVEYYSHISNAIRKHEDRVDTWLLLDMPKECYYHKHLMYNAGLILSRGKYVAFADSDAMVKDIFIERILSHFSGKSDLVLHLDQFRNMRRDLYPFNHPSFDEVMGYGCINNIDGKTYGLVDVYDPLHTRNYGACMCARRNDLVMIGGADEHIDYLGHICGPYDMTFRLVNAGHREVWAEDVFTYHTWHPGQAGEDNFLGPHDGRHVSTTALQSLVCGRVLPLVENPAIRQLRIQKSEKHDELLALLIRPESEQLWRKDNLANADAVIQPTEQLSCIKPYRGMGVYQNGSRFFVLPRGFQGDRVANQTAYQTLQDACSAIDATLRAGVNARILVFKAMRAPFRLFSMLTRAVRAFLRSPAFFARRLRNLHHGVSRVVGEQDQLDSNAIDVIVSAMQHADIPVEPGGKNDLPLVVVLRPSDAFVLTLMKWAKLIPVAKVLAVQNSSDVERFLTRKIYLDVPVLLQSSVFIRYHQFFPQDTRYNVCIV